MAWPQIILIVLTCLSMGISLQKHGDPERGTYNAWGNAIGCLITFSLLWWGGFFDVWIVS